MFEKKKTYQQSLKSLGLEDETMRKKKEAKQFLKGKRVKDQGAGKV